MTQQTPQEPERTPIGRVVLWTLLALALLIGVVLYFVYQRRVPTVL